MLWNIYMVRNNRWIFEFFTLFYIGIICKSYIVFHITNGDIDSIWYRPVWTKNCLNVRFLTMLSFRNNVGFNLKRKQLEALSSVNFCQNI